MTAYIPYPPAVLGKPMTPFLDGARDGAIRNVAGAKLRKEKRILISNRRGREAIADAPNNVVMIMRYFMMEDFLIEAVVVVIEASRRTLIQRGSLLAL